MNRKDVRYAQNIVHNDGTIIKVHHIDDENRVHFFAFKTKGNQGSPGLGDGMIVHNDNYDNTYGIVDDCRPASPSELMMMERWIIENTSF